MFQILQPADARHIVRRLDKLQHPRMPQQLFLGFEYIRDALRTQRVSRHQCLRNRALRFFLAQAAQIRRHRIHARSIELQLQRVSLRQARIRLAHDLVQPLAIWQREIEVLH